VRALPDYAVSLLRRGLVASQESRYLAGLLCSQIWTLPAQEDSVRSIVDYSSGSAFASCSEHSVPKMD
jgi:hypothetical protein